jgi:hypothetical protein
MKKKVSLYEIRPILKQCYKNCVRNLGFFCNKLERLSPAGPV